MAIGTVLAAAYGRPVGVTGNPVSISGTAATSADTLLIEGNWYCFRSPIDSTGSGVECSVISRSSGTGELNIAELRER